MPVKSRRVLHYRKKGLISWHFLLPFLPNFLSPIPFSVPFLLPSYSILHPSDLFLSPLSFFLTFFLFFYFPLLLPILFSHFSPHRFFFILFSSSFLFLLSPTFLFPPSSFSFLFILLSPFLIHLSPFSFSSLLSHRSSPLFLSLLFFQCIIKWPRKRK